MTSIRASRSAPTVKPVNVQVVSLDWKWLFIYPEQGVASVNQLTIPVGTPVQFRADLCRRHEQLLRAATRQPDLHHGRDGDTAESAGRSPRNLPRALGAVQRRRIFRHAFRCRRGADAGI